MRARRSPDAHACGSLEAVASSASRLEVHSAKLWGATDPAVSRVGIGRTAALWGTGGWKAGAQSVGVLSLSPTIQADYCICVAATAHKMAAG